MIESLPAWVPLVFLLIALVYASVGFGGGSSYLAVLVLLGLPHVVVPPIALTCNLIVTAGGCWHFWRAGHCRWSLILPFVLTSIPLAYLGGRMTISKELFCLLLGLSLLAVAIRLVLPNRAFERHREISPALGWAVGLPLGGALGFLAGLVGIGGGIFLSPILLLLRWANAKEAGAAASFFIVLNSMAGLAGQFHQGGAMEGPVLFPLAVAVWVGGQIGSRLGAYRLPHVAVQRLQAAFIFYVSVRLLMSV